MCDKILPESLSASRSFTMWLPIIFTAVVCILILLLTEKDPEPINGVYKRKGKFFYLKFFIFRLLYLKRKFENKQEAKLPDYKKTPELLETAQALSEHSKAFDAVFFVAANKAGYYLATGTERRKNGFVNGLCYLKVPGIGLLCSEKLPLTKLKSANVDEYSAEGIKFQMVKPMEKWRISYHGKMFLHSQRDKTFDVKFDGDWISEFEHFDYETEMHASAVARAFARETWSKDFFKALQEAHQSHYEQMGILRSSIIIDGEKRNFVAQAFRDHSFGNKRDWNLMHRYAFHIVFFRDGSSLVVAVISQPCSSSILEVGYTCSRHGEMSPIDWCDLKLYRHGEAGIPPTDYAFKYSAGGRTRVLEVEVLNSAEHRVDEAHMVERFVRVKDDGLPGYGVSEWHYHHKLQAARSIPTN